MMYDNRYNEMDMMESYEAMMEEINAEDEMNAEAPTDEGWAERMEYANDSTPLQWA